MDNIIHEQKKIAGLTILKANGYCTPVFGKIRYLASKVPSHSLVVVFTNPSKVMDIADAFDRYPDMHGMEFIKENSSNVFRAERHIQIGSGSFLAVYENQDDWRADDGRRLSYTKINNGIISLQIKSFAVDFVGRWAVGIKYPVGVTSLDLNDLCSYDDTKKYIVKWMEEQKAIRQFG